jgi:hypothetical protein
MALKVLLCSGNDESPQLRPINTLNSPKKYIRLLGGLSPIHLMCWGGAQGLMWGTGGHFRRRQLWSAMVVLVDVGRWRHTLDQSTVGIVEIVYRIIFYSYVDPIHS